MRIITLCLISFLGCQALPCVAEAQQSQAQPSYPMRLSDDGRKLAAELNEKLEEGSEARAMYEAIMLGKRLRPNEGWFKIAVSQSNLGWEKLSSSHHKSDQETLAKNQIQDDLLFRFLDRDGDQIVGETDFDWRQVEQRAGQKQAESTPTERTSRAAKKKSNLSREVLLRGLLRQEIGAWNAGPRVGDTAPGFTLKTPAGEPISLESQLGQRPTVLVFGNFTCGPFRRESQQVKEIAEELKSRANFLMVYVREAHSVDGWHSEDWEEEFLVGQPKSTQERSLVAAKCANFTNMPMPFLVDEIDDRVGKTYSGMPSRLYVLDSQGVIRFKSGRGPHGFRPYEMAQALAVLLLTENETKE